MKQFCYVHFFFLKGIEKNFIKLTVTEIGENYFFYQWYYLQNVDIQQKSGLNRIEKDAFAESSI